MKLKNKILGILTCAFIIPSLIVGCSKGISIDNSNSKVIFEESKKGVYEVSMYFDKDKATEELLEKELEKIAENKEIKEDNKAILIKFYEYENEAYYSDIVPYAIGFWGPATGLYSSYDQISTKNNKFFVEFSTEMDKGITTDDVETYKEWLEELKPEDNTKTNIQEKFVFISIANEDADYQEKKELLDNFITRYDKDAIENILVGNLE